MKMRLFSRRAAHIFLFASLLAVSNSEAQVYNEKFDTRFEISFDDAQKFHEYLVDHEHKISYEYKKFLLDYFKADSLSRGENLSDRFIKKIDYRLAQIHEAPEFNKNIPYKASIYQHVSGIKQVMENDADELFELRMNRYESPKDLIAYIDKLKEVQQKLQVDRDRLDEVRKEFFKEYDIKDVAILNRDAKSRGRDKVDPKDFSHKERSIQSLGKFTDSFENVAIYFEEIYLSYFKIQALNEKFKSAVEEFDFEKMDYYRRAIIHYADIELPKLENDAGLNGNTNYSKSCSKTILFYRNTAEKIYPKMIVAAKQVEKDLEEYEKRDEKKDEGDKKRSKQKVEKKEKFELTEKEKEEKIENEKEGIKSPIRKLQKKVFYKEVRFVSDFLSEGVKTVNQEFANL